MGQRLVITIHAFDEDVAKICFHWGAYTLDAIVKAKDIIKEMAYRNFNNKSDFILCLIRFLEKNEGGIDGGQNSKEFKYVKSIYKDQHFNGNPIRNNGLISISEDGMLVAQNWSDGDLTIDFDDETVHNEVFSFVGSKDEFNEFCSDLGEYYAEAFEDAVELNFDPETFDFNDIENVLDELSNPTDLCVFEGTYYQIMS